MSSSKPFDVRRSLALRLTLWYAAIFAVSAGLGFLLFYLATTSVIRRQADENLLKRAGQFATLLELYGSAALRKLAATEAEEAGLRKVFLRFLYPNGTVFSSSNMSNWQDIRVSRTAIQLLLEGKRHVFETIGPPGGHPSIRVLYTFIGSGLILQMGQAMESDARFLVAFRRILLAAMALLTLSAVGVGWVMARQALAGVGAVTRTAGAIADGHLDRRVPVTDRGDEIDQLAVTFNRMVDRLQKLVAGVKEMNENIAHDLRSPITRIRGLAEVTLTTATAPEEFETMAAGTIEECDRLLDTINTVLLIARTEAGVEPPAALRLDLTRTVREACDLFRPMAEDKKIQLACEEHPPVFVRGDIRLVQRMIANLLDNALKYTPPRGTVSITVCREPAGRITLRVRDTGIGIAPAEQPHIFKRFYRCDHSRSQPGTGLGLSLAQAVARAHGGDIHVESRAGEGSTFTVWLPEEA